MSRRKRKSPPSGSAAAPPASEPALNAAASPNSLGETVALVAPLEPVSVQEEVFQANNLSPVADQGTSREAASSPDSQLENRAESHLAETASAVLVRAEIPPQVLFVSDRSGSGQRSALRKRRRRSGWLRMGTAAPQPAMEIETVIPTPGLSEADWNECLAEYDRQLATAASAAQEKDLLIAALTDRLEQAAEQLDRHRRNGSAVAPRGGSGMPPELVEEHRATIEDLKGVLERWETLQFELSLSKLHAEVAEIHSLLRDTGAPRSPGGSASVHSSPAAAPAPVSGGSWWERQKAALLSGEPLPPEPARAAAPALEEAVGETPEGPEDVEMPDLPEAVDWDAMTLESARSAIYHRDEVISKLRDLVVSRRQGDLPLEAPAELPDWVQRRLSELEAECRAKFRQTELELSVERARLARTDAQLKRREGELESKIARPAAPPAPAGESDQKSAAGRRWFRFLGAAEEE